MFICEKCLLEEFYMDYKTGPRRPDKLDFAMGLKSFGKCENCGETKICTDIYHDRVFHEHSLRARELKVGIYETLP